MQCISCNTEEPNRNSGLCDNCEYVELKKINGLLYLPAAGLVLTVLFNADFLYQYIDAVMNYLEKTATLTWFAAGCVTLAAFQMLFTIYASWLFFNRKKSTRRIMVFYYILNLLSALYFFALPTVMFDSPVDEYGVRSLIGAAVGVVVWLPYFLLSKRIYVVFHK